MHVHQLHRWRHDHDFGTSERRSAERRTWWVIGLTLTMMVAEIAGGLVFGSMALLADGWHMGTHAAALGIAVFAYVYARRHAADQRFTFGTGKVGTLGGFASAVGLAVVALMVFGESVARFINPVAIRFDEAIAVAAIGLTVNLVSAWMLRDDHHHGHERHGHHHDHNLRAAYLHVLADALTSVLAIVALVAGKHLGWGWMDPAMGVVGSLVIARWSWGLLRDTSTVLLDAEASAEQRESIHAALEADTDNRVVDLHVWRVGPAHLAVIASIVTHHPRPPEHYRALLTAKHPELAHVTVEIHPCEEEPCLPTG